MVNVTPNLPNVFEDSGTIQYLQIPITDHWSQNLASFFPSAIGFIGNLSALFVCVCDDCIFIDFLGESRNCGNRIWERKSISLPCLHACRRCISVCEKSDRIQLPAQLL